MEEQQLSPLRFGIMVDDLSLEAWKVEAVRKLVEGGMHLAFVIRNVEPAENKSFSQRLGNLLRDRQAFFQVWNHYLFKPANKSMVDLPSAMKKWGLDFGNISVLDCKPRQEYTSTFILDNDIETIKNQQLDFILRFGFNIVRGEILNAAKYGVWSFHHDDEMAYRGGPPGFWEWMEDNPRNGIILQRLTESLDRGYVLNKRWYPTILHSYKAHLDQLLMESTDMPLQVCREIQHTGELKAVLSESKAVVRHPPRNIKMLKYWMLCVSRRWRFHWHELFRQEDWNVGYVEMPLKDFLASPEDNLKNVTWFEKKCRSAYYADPFVITTEKDTYIFFESYSYKQGKGRIEVVRKTENYGNPQVVLEESFHLSYPFVFEHDGCGYCLPECHQSNGIRLYRFNENELKMELDCMLMENVKAVDPTLVFHDGLWNLFFTQKDHPSVKLYRFVADNLKGPYQPCWTNPIKVDCADARMAGAFIRLDDQLFRPAQECVRYYGTAVGLNRVGAFNSDSYEESLFKKIEPDVYSKFGKGLHTLNGNDHVTVIDGKRWQFTFVGMSHQIKEIANRRKGHV